MTEKRIRTEGVLYESSEYADVRTFTLTLSDAALRRAKLTPFDRKLLAECDGPDATVSDKLLGLETLVRRIEEANV